MMRLDVSRILVCFITSSHRLEAHSQSEDNVAQLPLQPQYSLSTANERSHVVFGADMHKEGTIRSRNKQTISINSRKRE